MGRDRGWSKSGMKECPVCGREFWCYDLDAWAYRVGRNKSEKGPQICSWHCQVEYNRAVEEEKSQKAREKQARRDSRMEKKKFCWLGNLTEIMDLREVTNKEVVDATGVSSPALSGYRLCDGQCRWDAAVKIADFLRVAPEEIITEEPVYRTRKRRRRKKTPSA